MRARRSASSQSVVLIEYSPLAGRVALVEDQVDHLEHGDEPAGPLFALRHLEGHARGRQRLLGAHDALCDGRLGHDVGARDLPSREAAQQLQRQRCLRLFRQHRVACAEDQAQQVVADVIGARRVEGVDEIGQHVVAARIRIGPELGLLARVQRLLPQVVERLVLRGGHRPSPGVVGHAVARPVLEGGGRGPAAPDPPPGRRRAPCGRRRRRCGRPRCATPPRCCGRRHAPFGARFSIRARSSSSCARSSGVNGLAEIFGFEDAPDLDLGVGRHRIRAAAHPLDGLLHRAHLPQPEAGDQFLGLGERAVDHRARLAREAHARALAARVQPLAGEHHAGLDQLLVEAAHLGHQLGARHHAGFGIRGGLDHHHDAHHRISLNGSITGQAGRRAPALPTNEPAPDSTS